jgi:glutamate 5-kinase
MVVIGQGSESDVILRIAAGENIGTRIHPITTTLESRKRYILAGVLDNGNICVDQGAVSALRQGKSLLPVGVMRVTGKFGRGDTVHVEDPFGREVARGLTNYASGDLARIAGRHSEDIEKILGFAYTDEVIHRNNMVLI